MKPITKRQWISFAVWTTIYTLFAIWMENLWLLLGLPIIVDIFLTRFIPWTAWKKHANPKVQMTLGWVDDLLFALVAVYFINLFVFQNYQIPTSSLEKTLLVGDYLFVSKLSYGPRVPNTPISFPLVQNTISLFGKNMKSYIEWPRWGYKRVKGFGQVQRNDIVVFNFPAGDTVALTVQNPDYYTLMHEYGRDVIHQNPETFGKVIYRPVDKRENYVKRCVGMPGDTLAIVDNRLYIDGKPAFEPPTVQYNYYVETDGTMLTNADFERMDVSKSDRILASADPNYSGLLNYMGFSPDSGGMMPTIYRLPLTNEAIAYLKQRPFVRRIRIEGGAVGGTTYPPGHKTGWTIDNFGPLWIPKKGATIELNARNLALYGRCIRNYENNTLAIDAGGQVQINGKPETHYTFRYDYYFMMGDNRHNSADSRVWGFVPEDHIVGKPLLIWLSLDKDKSVFSGGIRWDRMFRTVKAS